MEEAQWLPKYGVPLNDLSFKYLLFDKVFAALQKNGIDIFALRDLGALNDVIESGSGDVDLYVSETNWKSCSAIIREFGFYNLCENQIFMHPDYENVLDVHHGYYKRAPFICDSDLRYGEKLDNGLLVLPNHILLAILLLHPLDLTGIRGNRHYSEARKTYIRKLYDDAKIRQAFFDWCRARIGERFSELVEGIADNDIAYTRLY